MATATGSPWRRSTRVQVRMRAIIAGSLPDGKAFKEEAHVLTVSKFGAKLRMQTPLQTGMEVVVRPLLRRDTAPFRVVWTGKEGTPRAGEAGIEYVHVSNLLGVVFPD